MFNVNNAIKLYNHIEKLFDTWDERSMFTIAGVKNLSVADLNMLQDICERIYNSDGNTYDNVLMKVGALSEVLEKYNIRGKQ